MWTEISEQIAKATEKEFSATNHRSVSGGCINQGYAVSDGEHTYFVKLNQASQVGMFEAEALGLQQMLETATIRVPKPICWGTVASGSAYLVLEWLELGRGDSQSWEKMGRQLAAMHRWLPSTPPYPPPPLTPPYQGGDRGGTGGDRGGRMGGYWGFGWEQNNTIGTTPQINSWTADWAEFYAQHRLGYQFQMAKRRRGFFPQQERLLAAIPKLLADHQPQPSLVHGDLWGGNAAFTATGEPVIFDPAVYFGDREVDIAMTELFGGFPAAFSRGYNEAWPLDPGYERRKKLYNLYHILNHFNLFGGGYGSQANGMIEQILGEVSEQ